VDNVYAKSGDDWLLNGKALADCKSDNNNTNENNNVRSAWRPVVGSKNKTPLTPTS